MTNIPICSFTSPHTHTQTLDCPSDFDYAFMLSFIQPRMIVGVESVVDNVYARSFRFVADSSTHHDTDTTDSGCDNSSNNVIDNSGDNNSRQMHTGRIQVAYLTKSNQLEVTIVCNHPAAVEPVLKRIRFMFDLDTDMSEIESKLKHDQVLQRGFVNGHVPRMPKAFDSFEFCVRAILGQQVSVKAATTLAGRVAHAADLQTPASFPRELDCFFPQLTDVIDLSFEGLGLTKTRIGTLITVIQALQGQLISLNKDQVFEDYLQQWTALKGVGPWTANYLAMRGLGIQDSFPDKDLGVLKALAVEGDYPSRKVVLQQAEAWQPYRAYATLCLWNGL
ncbi:DNA-3-methyladenine glycosylase 2 [Vibrio algicola]|uniref:DNA-3-methyladenine glycosylase II n=1 Tax=Vibrio algicola TaxID=2662262 RepID=A0A5Q0TL77_9VIBR|nr:AlkA N-terminal domain-containing protein [Vibrio algicola]